MYWTLCRATVRFKRLNALSASISKTALVSISWKMSRKAWMAASQPAGCPAHTCVTPAASMMSFFSTVIIALPMMRRNDSPMPIGRTPGFLSSGIRRLLRRALTPEGSTCSVARRRATSATALQSSSEAVLNETSIRHQTYESAIEGPAASWIANAVLCMVASVRHSNRIGLTAGISPCSNTSGLAG